MNLRREYNLRLGSIKSRIAKWQLWLDQYRCPHTFRPARIEGKHGRVCIICEKSQVLSPEDFFAFFGEKGQAYFIKTN